MGKIPKDKKSDLAEKHWTALGLIQEGGLTMKEIAKTVGIDYQYFQDLYSGDTEKGGRIAAVFQAEVKKILNKKDDKIKALMKESKELCLQQIIRITRDIKAKSRLSKDDQGMVVKLTTAVGRITPEIKIDKFQYKYVKGLSAEELISEFKRLGAVAEGPSDSRSVHAAEQGGSRSILGVDERGSQPDQVSEDN
jgi:hypothetical protein